MKLFLLALLASFHVLIAFGQTADVQNYVITAGTNESLVDGSGWTQIIGPNQQNTTSGIQPLGFEVWFMGERFTNFSVNVNGVLRFGNTLIASLANTSNIPGNARICAFSHATDTPEIQWSTESNGEVRYKVIGTAPNRTLVVDWVNLRMVGNEGSGELGRSRFQIHVNETAPGETSGGTAKIVYGQMRILEHLTTIGCGGTERSTTRSGIGYHYNDGGADEVMFLNTDNHPTVTTSYGTEITACNDFGAAPRDIGISSASNPNRDYYAFDPPSPDGNVANLVLSCVSSYALRLEWTESATNEVGIVIYRSTDGTNFNFLTQLPAGTTGYTDLGLTPSTTYYYRVFTVTEGELSPISGGDNTGSAVTPSILSVFSILSSNWNNILTWTTSALPLATENVVIGCIFPNTVTVNANGVANNLTVENGSTLTFNPGQTVTVNGSLFNNGTIDLNGGTLIIEGDLNNNGTGVINAGNGTIRLRGDFINQGAFNAQTSSVHFDGANEQLINHTGTGSGTGAVGTTTNTYSNPAGLVTVTPTSIPDNDAAGVSETFTFPATSETIDDVTLDLEIDHTWVGDLVVTLESPAGTVITLIDRPGIPGTGFGCSGDDINVTLSDAAASPAESACSAPPAIGGTLSPNNPLAGFDGENPSGTWTLTVSDNAALSTGNFVAATLNVTTASGLTSVSDNSTTPGLDIPDANFTGVDHCINVPNSGSISDVDIDLNISHSWLGDLEIDLTSPEGDVVTIMDDNGDGITNLIATFDDDGATAITSLNGTNNTNGTTFSPLGSLSDFDGEDPQGDWCFNFVDDASGDIGTVNGVTITITTSSAPGFPASSELYFYNLFVENTSNDGVRTQNTDVRVTNQATWTNGVFFADNNHLLIFEDNATSTIPVNASYGDLSIRKIGNEDFDFPTGNNGYAAPIGMSAPDNATDHFTARYFHVSPQTVPYDRNSKEPTIQTISNCEYWLLDRTNGSSAVAVRLSYDNTRSCGTGAPADLKVCRWNGSLWIDHFNGGNFTTPYQGLVSAGNISSFSPFTLGSTVPLNPLPVTWLSFDAEVQNKRDALLHWQTAEEINNDFFAIERSADGMSFHQVGTVPGNAPDAAYHYVDKDAILAAKSGTLYYRLRQVDTDGTFSYSKVRSVFFRKQQFAVLGLFPNPFTDRFRVSFNLPQNADLSLSIKDVRGQELWQKRVKNQPAGISSLEINPGYLPKGSYFLQIISSEEGVITQKLIRH